VHQSEYAFERHDQGLCPRRVGDALQCLREGSAGRASQRGDDRVDPNQAHRHIGQEVQESQAGDQEHGFYAAMPQAVHDAVLPVQAFTRAAEQDLKAPQTAGFLEKRARKGHGQQPEERRQPGWEF